MPDMETKGQVVVRNPFDTGQDIAARASATGLVSVEQQRAIAEVQARMIIARASPRDPMHAMDMIIQDCTRPSLAETAVYQYTRGGADVTGPSIRLAETIARRWGNIASGIKEISRRGEYSECVAYAWDLESGYYDERQFQVRHWRSTKQGGYLLTDERDIYENVANLGQRRKRAVLLSVIPGDVVEAAVAQCEATLAATADASPEAIKRLLAAFEAFGVTKKQIEDRCQRRAEAIRPAQIVQLRKIYASIKDEMSVPGDWFGSSEPPPPRPRREDFADAPAEGGLPHPGITDAEDEPEDEPASPAVAAAKAQERAEDESPGSPPPPAPGAPGGGGPNSGLAELLLDGSIRRIELTAASPQAAAEVGTAAPAVASPAAPDPAEDDRDFLGRWRLPPVPPNGPRTTGAYRRR